MRINVQPSVQNNRRPGIQQQQHRQQQQRLINTTNSYINPTNGVRNGASYKISELNNHAKPTNGFVNNRSQQQHQLQQKQQPTQQSRSNNNMIINNVNKMDRAPKTKMVDRINSQENNNTIVYSNRLNNVSHNNNNNDNKVSNFNINNGILDKTRQQRPLMQRNIVNGRPKVKSINDTTIGITPDLRKFLRPTVTKINQDDKKKINQNQDNEDTNGPYNFRKLLKPAGYLPTESLRKRKGAMMSNGASPPAKEKVCGKPVKRRAPLAPNVNSKTVVGRK